MGFPLAGRHTGVIMALGVTSLLACTYLGPSRPLRPRLLFTVGSEFLQDASNVALKGRIEFDDGRKTEAGKFTAFISGTDSISLLIEGPLNIDVFKMVIAGQAGFVSDPGSPSGWQELEEGSRAEIAEYGIENISPFLTGFFVFPQFYFSAEPAMVADEGQFSRNGIDLEYHQGENEAQFAIEQPDADLIAVYSGRKDVPRGYYPSRIEISDSQRRWRIAIHITALRAKADIPEQVWLRD